MESIYKHGRCAMSGSSHRPGCEAEFQKSLTEEALIDVKNTECGSHYGPKRRPKRFPRESRNASRMKKNPSDGLHALTGACTSTTKPAMNTPMLILL